MLSINCDITYPLLSIVYCILASRFLIFTQRKHPHRCRLYQYIFRIKLLIRQYLSVPTLAINVVPLPPNKSRTMFFILLLFFIALTTNSTVSRTNKVSRLRTIKPPPAQPLNPSIYIAVLLFQLLHRRH